MIEVAEAKRLLMDEARVLEPVEVGLGEALGRVLAQDVFADRDLPAGDVSTMDGFAVRAQDVGAPGAILRIAGEARAGQAPGARGLAAGEAIRILTGALIPKGADTVVMVELSREDPAGGTVEIREKPDPGQNIRRRGEDARGGERILERGSVVHAAEIAALAAVGRTRFLAFRPPVVHVVSTGDEVVEADGSPEPHQVRNSNAHALLAQLRELGIEGTYLGIAPDEPRALEEMLREGLLGDVLLVTGGVSAGARDLVAETLARAGTRVLFHKVAVRPGKPILAGRSGSCLAIGLPGNPVSTFTAFAVFVAPALRKMMGHLHPEAVEVRAVLAERLKRRPGRTTYHLARLEVVDGRFVAHPVRTMGSGDAISLVRASAYVVTPGAADALEAGSEVAAVPWKDFHLR